MSAVKNKDSKIEIEFGKRIWREGVRYRKNPRGYFGKPDLVVKKHKTAIFVDSCFWHGCKKHCRMPFARRNYWTQKILRNTIRDKEVVLFYKKLGWGIFRIWEHDLSNEKKFNGIKKLRWYLK